VTRIAPFRTSTLVSIAPVNIVDDFGTMSRHEGDPVPHEHQFYRTTLKGLFSLDLHDSGTFYYQQKTGYRNLDDTRIERAEEMGLTNDGACYRLPLEDRVARICALFEGLAHLEGGAKLTLHYTDVAPSLVILAVTKGGNHIFGHTVGATKRGQPEIDIEALQEALTVFQDDILSDVYVGWVKGYLDEERVRFEAALTEDGALVEFANQVKVMHPRQAFQSLIAELKKTENVAWLA
jgi:CRISPR-associated protein Cst2